MWTSFVRIITIEQWENDCMLEYVLSDKKSGYLYELEEHKYHIDSEKNNYLKEVWISRWCLVIPYDKQFSFMAFSNSFYCSVVTLIKNKT